ncbi:MAG TPA: hypothetical protein PLE18_13280 [Candidatus Sumerlaeota bacterium]|nr:hypothetical protein [Candidatus Sumerlaeota bacterium]
METCIYKSTFFDFDDQLKEATYYLYFERGSKKIKVEPAGDPITQQHWKNLVEFITPKKWDDFMYPEDAGELGIVPVGKSGMDLLGDYLTFDRMILEMEAIYYKRPWGSSKQNSPFDVIMEMDNNLTEEEEIEQEKERIKEVQAMFPYLAEQSAIHRK